jgi:hypothetical protein
MSQIHGLVSLGEMQRSLGNLRDFLLRNSAEGLQAIDQSGRRWRDIGRDHQGPDRVVGGAQKHATQKIWRPTAAKSCNFFAKNIGRAARSLSLIAQLTKSNGKSTANVTYKYV